MPKKPAKKKTKQELAELPRGPGRPSLYKPEYADQVINYLELGKTMAEAAKMLRISRDTMYEWARQHPEFNEAMKTGREWSEATNLELMRLGAVGQIKGYHHEAHKTIMRNAFGWDKQEGTIAAPMQINIGSMNILNEKSTQDLLEYINEMKGNLKDIIDVTEYETLEALIDDSTDGTTE